MDRILDAYCPPCGTPVRHTVMDPGSCQCTGCGEVQLLVEPLG